MANRLSRGEAMALAKAAAIGLAEAQKLYDRYGPDHEDGTVIRFVKQFPSANSTWDAFPMSEENRARLTVNRTFIYAAVRANGLWYTTGPKSPKGYSWDEMLDWMEAGIAVTAIDVWPLDRKQVNGSDEESDHEKTMVMPKVKT